MPTMRSASALVLLFLAACGASTPKPIRPAPPPLAKVIPTYGEIASAPACVRKVAEARRAAADLRLSGRGHGTLPSLGAAWTKMRDAEGTFVPFDLRRDWDAPVRVSVALTGNAGEKTVPWVSPLGEVRNRRSRTPFLSFSTFFSPAGSRLTSSES
jgi:hypothetical protein